MLKQLIASTLGLVSMATGFGAGQSVPTPADAAKDKTLFRFDIAPGNSKLSCSIDGVSHGSVSSPTLCRAFASVYMGPGSVSPTLKNACEKTLTSWK